MVANVNELSRVRRRIDRRFGPCEAFVIPKPSEKENAMDLEENMRKPIPPWLDWLLVAIVLVAVGAVLYGAVTLFWK